MSQPESGANNDENDGVAARAFAEHQAALLRYATRMLGDRERAKDVVQDVYVRFLKEPAQAVDGHVVEWLYTVCRRRAIDVLRKEGRMTSFVEGAEVRLRAMDPLPGVALEQGEIHERLLRLIAALPPSQQEVVRLKFQEGFSYKEISRITELSVGNVGFLIHTAVQRLRKAWETAGD